MGEIGVVKSTVHAQRRHLDERPINGMETNVKELRVRA